jgi:geranylgeranyl diphosphate synthase type I
VKATQPAPLPAAVSGVARVVDRRLEEMFESEQARWTEIDPDLISPLSALRACTMSGGKRLRPAFCYWAFVGCGGATDDPAVVDAGAALEMLHTAALVHDAGGWKGGSQQFGTGVAILLGDLALVYSDRLLAGSPDAAEAVFDEMRLEVNFGQYLDVLGSAQGVDVAGEVAVARARRICRYKTAKYTVERPLHLGAALAAPEKLAEVAGPLSRFGLPLGEAFQLRDDLLGVFGDPVTTGKPVGDDLRNGKPTLLASLAASRATGEGARMMADRFGASDLDASEVAVLQEVIETTGARAEVERTVRSLLDAAVEALGTLPLSAPAVAALREIADFVAGRDH